MKTKMTWALALLALGAGTYLLARRVHAPRPAAVVATTLPPTAVSSAASPPASASARPESAETQQAARFQQRILDLLRQKQTPAEAAALLRALHRENPQLLFEVLLSLRDAPLDVQSPLLPLLADGLTLWPEAEGRYVTPIADTFSDLNLPASAQWAARFLATTRRDDLSVSTLIGRLAETDDAGALDLVVKLSGRAQADAISSIADHIPLDNLDHAISLAAQLDPRGDTYYAPRLFNRLASEQLAAASRWLENYRGSLPPKGAAAAVAQAMVRADRPLDAIRWADALANPTLRSEAIAAVYQTWAHGDPEKAIQDILKAYPENPELIAQVFGGAAEHHGSGPATHWDTAQKLTNESARAYAISALIEPLLLTVGQKETASRIAALPTGSLEKKVAEISLASALQKPEVAGRLNPHQSAEK